MQVFIAHAEFDQTTANELKAFLRARGLVAETETGAQGFQFLQRGDVVIGLWSNATMFSTYRMLFERRMFDAWADKRLVFVKLDHAFAPVGLRDIPFIDASFVPSRNLTAWSQIASVARSTMGSLLAEPSLAGAASDDPNAPPAPARSAGWLSGFFRKRSKGAPSQVSSPSTSDDGLSKTNGPPLFFSYAHADVEAVDPVVKDVEAAGLKVWIDRGGEGGGIAAGEGWAGEIVRGIKMAAGVVVMCSPRAFESDHIKREVYLADKYKKRLLPAFIAEAQMPDDFEYFFAGVQWLELFRLPQTEWARSLATALKSI